VAVAEVFLLPLPDAVSVALSVTVRPPVLRFVVSAWFFLEVVVAADPVSEGDEAVPVAVAVAVACTVSEATPSSVKTSQKVC
jgi:hypothetical protein